MKDALIYWPVRLFLRLVQTLPLPWVARLGRTLGALAWALDARHRRVVRANLALAFGTEKSATEREAIARENFRRIGESWLCAVKTATMSQEQLRPHLEFVGTERFPTAPPGQLPPSVVVAIGHFGNFELYARFHQFQTGRRSATTYRALDQPALNRLMQDLREKSGCLYFERRTGGAALRAAMREGGLVLGLLADQSSLGLRGPFLGQDCNTGLAPAVLALRYECELYTAICYRTALAHWRVELGERIPTRDPATGAMRPAEDIMTEVNRALETAVRRDPANWFWVHRRWKK